MSALVSDLVTRVLQYVDRAGDASYTSRVVSALDEAIQWYSERAPWDGLRDIETFISNGTEYLALPDRIRRVVDIGDKTNNRYIPAGEHFLQRRPGQYLERTSGNVCEWRDMGTVPLITHPNGSALKFETTVSESFDVSIAGTVRDTGASGTALEFYEAMETVSMDGTVKTSANVFEEVTSIQKEKNTAADLKIFFSSTSEPVSRIPNWETRPLYRRVQFSPVPTAGTALELQYYRRPNRITDTDAALDSAINQEAVVWKAVELVSLLESKIDLAQLARARAEEVVRNRKEVEENFGERDHTIQPWCGYLNLEDDYGGEEYS